MKTRICPRCRDRIDLTPEVVKATRYRSPGKLGYYVQVEHRGCGGRVFMLQKYAERDGVLS